MIIVSITGPQMRDALAQIEGSRLYADAIELRLDRINTPDVVQLIRAARLPVIATCRPVWEGGAFSGSDDERRDLLRAAVCAGAAYIDVELRAGERFRSAVCSEAPHLRCIVSLHRLNDKGFDVAAVYRRLDVTGAYAIKLAYAAADAWQNRRAYDFLALARRRGRRAVAIAMGEYGEMSRVAYRAWGGWATYASPEAGVAAAPGQIPARMMREIFHAHDRNVRTRLFGVVGHPVAQSKGIFVHNALFQRNGVNALYSRVPVLDLSAFMRKLAPLMSGFSVTIPHKEKIVRYLDAVHPAAKAIGAVNTVIRKGLQLRGTNTDAPAALDAIEEAALVRGRTMLIVGAGGAARAIAYEARRRGAQVMVMARTARKAEALARALDVRCVDAVLPGTFDILVNATPVGMAPADEQSPVPQDLLTAGIVFDAVYNPPETRLLREAQAAGAKTVAGTEMYLNQAALQARLFMGKTPDKEFMREVLSEQL